MYRLSNLPLMVHRTHRGRDQFILAIIFPKDRADDLSMKFSKRFMNTQNINILFFPITGHQSRNVAIVDGVCDVTVAIANRSVHHNMNCLPKMIHDNLFSSVHFGSSIIRILLGLFLKKRRKT